MKFLVKNTNPLNEKVEIFFVLTGEGKQTPVSALWKGLNQICSNDFNKILQKEGCKGAFEQARNFYCGKNLPFENLAFLGLGKKDKVTLETVRQVGGSLQKMANALKAKTVSVFLDDTLFKGFKPADFAQALAEGILFSTYQYTKFKKEEKLSLDTVTVFPSKKGDANGIKKSIETAELLCEGMTLARDLVNGPGALITPKFLADTAKSLKGVQTKIYNLAEIKKMKMGAFLSVARGSTENPPYFIEMLYRPSTKPKKKIALIGKGVTFDTGGYSLKNPKAMESMKEDMSGAAAVISTMSLLSRLKPKVEVRGYIAATENMIDGGAQRPGDICTARNGKTIEVLNTDAEGRLTLADALCYANEKKPDLLIDMATLTGACVISLGTLYSGVMGNDASLIQKIIRSGQYAGENFWHLPLPEEYEKELKSQVADLKNIGGSYAGTLTAGLFLQHFVDRTPWAHIDIAGPCWTDSPKSYQNKGATGVMVRTLVRFLQEI